LTSFSVLATFRPLTRFFVALYGQAYYGSARYNESGHSVHTQPKGHMYDLHKLFNVPFDDKEISLDELLSGSTDSLQRMIANNPGGFLTARITATTTALTNLTTLVSSDDSKLGLRKARKAVKDAFRAALPGKVANIGAAVAAKYGASAPELSECFPLGRKVFGSCTDDKVAGHLTTLNTAVTAHAADLPAQVVTDTGALLTDWTAIYNASETSTGNKTSTQEEKNAARMALQLELYLNVLAIVVQYPRQPEKLDLYLQQSLFEDHPAETEEPTPPPAP
jgi:hypothetical protein